MEKRTVIDSSKIEVKVLEVKNIDCVDGIAFKNHISPPNQEFHTHKNYHEVMLVFNGCIGNEVNGKAQTIEEMQMCFIRKDDIHRHYSIDGKVADLYNIGIPVNVFEDALKYLNIDFSQFIECELPTIITLHKNDYGSIRHKIELLKNVEYGPMHGTIFLSFVHEVLFLFYTNNIKFNIFAFNKDAPEWLYKLVEEFRSPENFIGGIPKMLEISGYSQPYLNRILKKHLGITPTKMLNILKLDYAKKLLASGEFKIIDICYKCGYNNEGYFYREFKKQYGITPGQFLENQQLF